MLAQENAVPCHTQPQTIDVLGVPIHLVTLDQVLERVEDAIVRRTCLRLGVVNAAKLVAMNTDAVLCDDVLSSDLVLADGMSIVWAARVLGHSAPSRIAGVDLMYAMFERGGTRGYRFYCLGATEEVNACVARQAAEQFPGLHIAGRHNGYFSDDEESDVARQIRESGADILLVAMPSPRKERFMGRWGDELCVPVVHGVGGSFDVFAGKVRRAPLIWQRLGMEWLYRLLQEPRRLARRYIVTNSVFSAMVVREWLSRNSARL